MKEETVEIVLPPGMTLERLLKIVEKQNKPSTNTGSRNSFRCYACLEYIPESKLGGIVQNKKLCDNCFHNCEFQCVIHDMDLAIVSVKDSNEFLPDDIAYQPACEDWKKAPLNHRADWYI